VTTSGRELFERQAGRGLGDTVARLAHYVGADKLAQAYTSLTGRDCGCQQRQEALNRLVPYGKP
jgi:hypothetical protein